MLAARGRSALLGGYRMDTAGMADYLACRNQAVDFTQAETANLTAVPILYAVARTEVGVALTVFEGDFACTVELTQAMARQLSELLVVEADEGNDGDG